MPMMQRRSACLISCFLLLASPASAQQRPPSAPPTPAPAAAPTVQAGSSGQVDQQIAAQIRVIAGQRDALQRRIDTGMRELQRAIATNPEQMDNDRIARPFREMIDDVQKLLEQLDANGALADAIARAEVSARRTRGFWARQPQDETQQDLIRQLDRNIQAFQDSQQQLLAAQQQARQQLSTLLERQLRIERIAATRQFNEVARQLEGVISGLRDLTSSLANLEQTTNRAGAAN
jgi:hypothetical protein